jgi:hypothetical protein
MRNADVSMNRRLTWQHGYPIDNMYSWQLKCWIADNATPEQYALTLDTKHPKITRRRLVEIMRKMPQAYDYFAPG